MKHNLPAILYFDEDGDLSAASDSGHEKWSVSKVDGFFTELDDGEQITTLHYHGGYIYIATNKNRVNAYKIKKETENE